MAELRLGQLGFLDVLKAKLYGVVAVFSVVFFWVTTQGPASITVTGMTLPLSSKIWVMPTFCR